MTSPRVSTCSDWCTLAQVRDWANLTNPPTDADIETAINIASDLLYEATWRRFPGDCTDVVRPCSRAVAERYGYQPAWTSWSGDAWPWDWGCSCNRSTDCGCSTVSEITLPRGPVTSITHVKEDGVTVASSLYRVDDFRHLVRLPDADGTHRSWGCCQQLDLPVTEEGTFEVAYRYGVGPPPGGVTAAALLAGQIALLLTPGMADKCKLPSQARTVARFGQTLDLSALGKIAFGIPLVDAFIETYARPKRPSAIVNPDQIAAARRTT